MTHCFFPSLCDPYEGGTAKQSPLTDWETGYGWGAGGNSSLELHSSPVLHPENSPRHPGSGLRSCAPTFLTHSLSSVVFYRLYQEKLGCKFRIISGRKKFYWTLGTFHIFTIFSINNQRRNSYSFSQIDEIFIKIAMHSFFHSSQWLEFLLPHLQSFDRIAWCRCLS